MGLFKKPVMVSSSKTSTRGVEEDIEDFVNAYSSWSESVNGLSSEEQEQFKTIFNGVIDDIGTKLIEAEDRDQMGEVIAELTKDDQQLLLDKLREQEVLKFEK